MSKDPRLIPFLWKYSMKRLVQQELLFLVGILPDDISTPHTET